MTLEQALLTALVTTWSILGAAFGYIRHLYQERDELRVKRIETLERQLATYVARDQERQRAMEHQIETQQLALATMARQNELLEALQAQAWNVQQKAPRTRERV